MNRLASLAVLIALVMAPTSSAQDPLPWLQADNARAKIQDGVVEVAGEAGPGMTTLLSIDHPKVPSHIYAVRGKIKYEKVEGVGHLEMWSLFPGRGAFFSKTLADGGPMAKIQGSSDWRDFELPFFSEPGLLPEKITVQLVLVGPGKVWLQPMRLEAHSGTSLGVLQPWILGPILGVGVGLLGALAGILASMPSTRGLALRLFWLLAILGVVFLLAGVALWWAGAQYGWWYGFGLAGLILAAVSGGNIPVLKKRIHHDETLRMQAMDLGV